MVWTDCNSEVLGIFDSLEFSVMDVVLAGEGIPFVGDPYDLTFVRIQSAWASPFPTSAVC